MIFLIIKKLTYSISLIYTINIFIAPLNKIIPINKYTILIVSLFDFLGLIAILFLKYYT